MAPKRSHALRARDSGLRRISIATRSLVALSVGAAGVFSVIAARAQSGHTNAVRGGAAGTGLNGTSATTPRTAPAQSSDDGFQTPTTLAPPPSAPSPGYQYDPTPVVAGAT